MRRSRALAGGLILAVVAATGCGTSTVEQIKSRDPSGQGLTRGPDISVEAVDDLRGVEVLIVGNRFQPQQVSIALDESVRLVNNSGRRVTIRKLRGTGKRIKNGVLKPGEVRQFEYLSAGVEEIGLKGSKARLMINIFPPGG